MQSVGTKSVPVSLVLSAGGDIGATLLALALAESDLQAESERWASRTFRNMTASARSLIADEDWSSLRALIQVLTRDGGQDISFGCTHQTYRWSHFWDGWDNLDAILRCRKWYFQPENALREAAIKLKKYRALEPDGGPLRWLCRYNKPATAEVAPSVLARYQWGIEQAHKLLEEHMADLSDRGYQLGFLELANKLADEGFDVGWPVEEERQLGHGITFQTTDQGLFWYQDGGHPLFLADVRALR